MSTTRTPTKSCPSERTERDARHVADRCRVGPIGIFHGVSDLTEGIALGLAASADGRTVAFTKAESPGGVVRERQVRRRHEGRGRRLGESEHPRYCHRPQITGGSPWLNRTAARTPGRWILRHVPTATLSPARRCYVPHRRCTTTARAAAVCGASGSPSRSRPNHQTQVVVDCEPGAMPASIWPIAVQRLARLVHVLERRAA